MAGVISYVVYFPEKITTIIITIKKTNETGEKKTKTKAKRKKY